MEFKFNYKKWLKIAGIIIGSVILLLVVLWALLQTPFAKQKIANFISNTASKSTPYQIQLTGLHGTIPFNIAANNIRIADATNEIATIEGLYINPNLLPLLSGNISIDKVFAEAIHLKQLPQGEPKEQNDTTFEIPEINLPTNLPQINVKQIAVEQISLATSVFGIQQSYSLTGQLTTGMENIANASFELNSLKYPEAALLIDAKLIGEEPRLLLNLDWNHAANFLPMPLPIEEENLVNVQLTGEGPLSNWQADFNINSSEFGKLKTNINLSLTDQAKLQITGNVNPATGVLNATQTQLFGDEVDFEFDGLLQGNTVNIQSFRADLQNASAALSGNYNLEQQSFNADLNINFSQLGQFQQLVNQPLAGSGNIVLDASGTIKSPKAIGNINLENFQFADVSISKVTSSFELSPTDRFKMKGETIPPIELTTKGVVNHLVVSGTKPISLNQLGWHADIASLANNQLQVNQLDLNLPDGSIQTSGIISPLVPSASMQIDGNIANLSNYQPLVPIEGIGGLQLKGNIIADASKRTATADLSGTVQTTEALDKNISGMVGESVNFDLKANWDDDIVQVPQLNLKSDALNIGGTGTFNLATQELDADWNATLEDLAPLSETLNRPIGGKITTEGTLSGPISSLNLDTNVQSQDFTLNNVLFDQIDLDVNVKQILEGLQGELRFDALRNQDEFTVNSSFQLSGSTIQLSNLTVDGPGITLSGEGTINQKTNLIDFTIEGGSNDLSQLGQMFNEPLEGQFSIDAELQPVDSNQTAEIFLTAQNIETEFASLNQMRVSVNVDNLYEQINGQIDATVQELQFGENKVESLNIDISGNRGNINWLVQAEGNITKDFQITTEGSVDLEEALNITISVLNGVYGEIPIELQNQSQITIAQGNYELEPLQLSIGQSSLSASGYANNNNVDAAMELSNLHLSMLSSFGIDAATGVINSQIDITGSLESPIVNMQLSGNKIRYTDAALKNIPSGNLNLEATYENQQLISSLEITNIAKEPIVAQTQIPMELSIEPFQFQLIKNKPIDGQVNATINLSMIPVLFYLEGQKLSGILRANVQLGGTINQPEPSGDIYIDNGSYDHLDVGIVLRKINVHLALQDMNHIVIENLSLTDGGNGTVTGQGVVNLDEEQSIQTELIFNNATLLRQDELTATASGNLSCVGNLSQLNVNGNLTAAPIEISIPKNLPNRIKQIEIVEVGKDDQPLPQEEPEPEPEEANIPFGEKVQLNLTINIPNRMFVRGRGMMTEWEGNLNVKGTLKSPSITGRLSVIRGNMNFFNNQLEFVSGTVSFNGDYPPSPFLNLTAETTKNNTTFQLQIDGSVTSPNINLSSDPPMPSDEILAQLLFGRRLTDITPIQAIQLAQAANTLRGGGGAFDLLGKTREALGVEQVELRMGDDNDLTDVRLGIGAYLTESIYVDFEQGVGMDTSKFNVEVEILPGLSLESNVGLDQSSGLGVYWKHDY